ncbi:MAG: hypothetical protein SF187_24740 [Deltaproteobacteria bacterium]|nr:hypothetical protein [Deltaproteobacteria bacterium]
MAQTAEGTAAAALDGAYPPAPSGPVMVVEPLQPMPTWRAIAGPTMIAVGLGSIVGGFVLRSAANAKGREIELAEAGFEGVWPRELKDERQQQIDEVDSLKSEKDRYETLLYPTLLGGAIVCLVGTFLLLRRPSQSEFKMSLGRASLGGRF